MGKLLAGIALVASMAGTAYTLWVDPASALRISIGGTVLALIVCRALDEYGWLLAILAVTFALLGNGLYALHLLGVTTGWLELAGVVLLSALGLVLLRALVASGAADPYDD